MAFRKGSDAAKEASKGQGGNFAKTEYLKVEDGESVYVRFLTDMDGWITVNQHQMVPTKGKPAGYTGNWPAKMGAVCRYDNAFDGVYSDCYICDHLVDGKTVKKPAARQWALACLREEVRVDGGVTYKDQTREVTRKDDKGNETKEIEKAIVIVNMGFKNFFSVLEGPASHYGTALDRDYLIKRSGKEIDTVYAIIGMDPVEINEGTKEEPVWARMDLRKPAHLARYATDLDLEEIINERASDSFYAKFFDPRVTASDDGKVEKTGADAPKPGNDVDNEAQLAELASRLKPNPGQETVSASAGSMRNFDE